MTTSSPRVPGLPANVTYDAASAYPWGDLNETAFVTAVFTSLADTMGDAFARFEFVVLSSHDPHVMPASAAGPAGNKVLVFISDETGTPPTHLSDHYRAIFKAYLTHEPVGTNIFPFSLGTVRTVPALPVKPVDSRSIGIFFSGNLNANRFPLYWRLHPVLRLLPEPAARLAQRVARRIGWPALRMDFTDPARQRHIRFTPAFKGGLGPVEYGHLLADSKIVLCPRGFTSAETFRHMEAMRAGAIVVSEPLPATRFYAGSPIVTATGWEDGLREAERLLGQPGLLREMQAKTIEWWQSVGSEPAVAAFMHDAIRRVGA